MMCVQSPLGISRLARMTTLFTFTASTPARELARAAAPPPTLLTSIGIWLVCLRTNIVL